MTATKTFDLIETQLPDGRVRVTIQAATGPVAHYEAATREVALDAIRAHGYSVQD
jgi:hypothetical protein